MGVWVHVLKLQDYIDGNFSYVSIEEPGGRPKRFVGTTQVRPSYLSSLFDYFH